MARVRADRTRRHLLDAATPAPFARGMSAPPQLQAEAQRFRDDFQNLRAAVGAVIVGQQRVVEGVLTAVIAGGNVLLEGVPGLGKTELVKTLARALALDFRRISWAPT